MQPQHKHQQRRGNGRELQELAAGLGAHSQADQDYYLDVAAAAQFDNSQFSASSPFQANRRSLQASHHQMSQQDVDFELATFVSSAAAQNNHHQFSMPIQNLSTSFNAQQQQQQMLLFDDHHLQTSVEQLKQHQEDFRLSEQALIGAGDSQSLLGGVNQADDYDDYAVPSDESCCRLERSQVELVQLIGEGQKGYVFLGKLQSRSGHSTVEVAIKTLKYETEQLIERLMSEAAMMKQLEHPHIIKFIGMCPETPALIAMELARYGEIKHFLKLHQNAIKISQLVLFAFQISTALSYLESKNYVHRDVAARNVLVCSPQCVKLADFGLSRHLQPSNMVNNNLRKRQTAHMGAVKYPDRSTKSWNLREEEEEEDAEEDQDGGQQLYVAAPRVKLPVRWLAPESLVFRRFTSASDVWMFAVCTWELFHCGLARPWPQLRNNQVLLAIEAGQRLSQPDACPQRLYQLMLKCWSYAPVQRPKFREIKQSIWSIYLNERTREQLELEQFERAKQRYLIGQQQQQLAALAANRLVTSMPNSNNNLNAQAPQSYSTYSSTNTTTDRSTSPGSSSAGVNSLARRNSHRAAGRQRQQLDLELVANDQLGPLNVDRRRYAAGQAEVREQRAGQAAASLQAQWDRFQRRAASPAVAQAPQLPVERRQPHVLQKQRSQGAIPSESLRNWTGIGQVAHKLDDLATCDNKQAIGRLGERESAKKRRSPRRRPIDDEALGEFRRGKGELARQRLYAATLKGIDCDEDEDDGRGENAKLTSFDHSQMAPEVRRTLEHERLLNCQLLTTTRNLTSPSQLQSVSPALTTGSESEHQPTRSGASSRLASLEPTYEGLATAGKQRNRTQATHHQHHQQHAKLSSGNQVAMLRAKYDPPPPPSVTPSPPTNFQRQLTSSPALTAATQTPATSRPASWLGSDAGQQRQQPEVLLAPLVRPSLESTREDGAGAPMRVARPPDQLGQMLQALRITPMKARLKSPPEQSVRVLQRGQQEESVAIHQAQAQADVPLEAQVAPQAHKAAPGNRLLLHQRLLGRIRPSASSGANTGANLQGRTKATAAASAETTVEQSLQLLESLMQPQGGSDGQQLAATASLPRARPRPK